MSHRILFAAAAPALSLATSALAFDETKYPDRKAEQRQRLSI
jgi:hypothetical protein